MEDKNYIVYKNLYAEIVRKSISLDEMAKSLGITYSTLMAKLSGKETFKMKRGICGECFSLKRMISICFRN